MLFVERRVERTAVHANANRHLTVACFFGDGLNVLRFADVARVESQPMYAGLERSKSHFVLVVDVGDDRNRRTRHDLCETLGGLDLVAGATNDVAAGSRKCVDLLQRAFDVGGLRDGHGLHADGCVAPDGNFADVNLTGLFARVRGGDGGLSHASVAADWVMRAMRWAGSCGASGRGRQNSG